MPVTVDATRVANTILVQENPFVGDVCSESAIRSPSASHESRASLEHAPSLWQKNLWLEVSISDTVSIR